MKTASLHFMNAVVLFLAQSTAALTTIVGVLVEAPVTLTLVKTANKWALA